MPLALFPPPSITPRTAAIPRSPLRRARFLVSFAVWLSMSKPSSPAPLATLRLQTAVLSFLLTRNASLAAAPDQIPADGVVGAADRRADRVRGRCPPSECGRRRCGRPGCRAPSRSRCRLGLWRRGFGRSRCGCRGHDDAGSVSSEAVASHLIAVRLSIRIPRLLRENRFPLITLSLESATWIPGPALWRIELCTIRTWLESNSRSRRPSGAEVAVSGAVSDHASGEREDADAEEAGSLDEECPAGGCGGAPTSDGAEVELAHASRASR